MADFDADTRLLGVLEEWGFAHLLPKFVAAEVDYEAFCLFDDDTLKHVLSVGAYLKFKDTYHSRKASLGPKPTLESIEPPSKRRRLDDAGEGSSNRITQIVTSDDDADDEGVDLDDATTVMTLSPLAEAFRNLMKETLPGRILLCKKALEEPDRNRLCELLVTNYLLRSNGVLSSEFLTKVSKAVKELFPDESPITYYSPYTKVLDKVFYAKGKLVNQYYTWREEGIKAGIFPGRSAPSSTDSEVVVPNADVKASLDVLISELGPEDHISHHWDSTFEYRSTQLHQDEKFKRIHNYFALYPCLRQPWAASLLVSDYAKLQPESGSLVDQWPTFASKIVSMLSKKKILCKQLCSHLKESIHESGEGCQEILLQFSKLFRQQLVVKGTKKAKQWTANKSEIQEGFFHHVATDAQLNDFITNRQRKLSNHAKPIPFQPICVVVGLTLDNITSSYCVVATERFSAASPLAALDFTFKAVHALDLNYPPESKALWYFLQHSVYKIQTPKDEVITYLPALLSTYERS